MTGDFKSLLLGSNSDSERICLLELGTLISAGVKTPEALVAVAEEKSPFSDIFKVLAARMLPGEGKCLWEILGADESEFSSFVPDLIHAGEEAKCLGSVLIDASDVIAGIQKTQQKQLVDSKAVLVGLNYYMWALLRNAAPDNPKRIYEVLASCAMPNTGKMFRQILERLESKMTFAEAVQNLGLTGVEGSVLSIENIAHLTDRSLNGLSNLLLKGAIDIRLDALKVKR